MSTFRSAALRGLCRLQDRWSRFSRKQQYFLAYTVCFLLVSSVAFIWFIVSGRTFVYNTDGWVQHYKALVYWGQYLRSFVKSVFSGHPALPEWDFAIGEGNDVLTALHYYVIGDPLTLLAVAVPTKYMWALYDSLNLLRLYLAGIVFSLLCFQTGRKNRYGILAGALAYAFCYWALYNTVRHPYFLNPLIYLPLLIMGVEKIIRGDRPWLFVGAVFVSAVSNFYFFYIQVLVTVLYVLLRLFFLYRGHLKEAVGPLLRIGFWSVLGVLLSAAILLPVMNAFLSSDRMTVENGSWLLYPFSHYSKLPSIFISPAASHWLFLGYSVTVIPALFLLFYKKRQHLLLKALLLAGFVIMLLPPLGKALNGFAYDANRWSFAYALPCAYALTVMWPSLMDLSGKEARFLIGCTAGYFLLCAILKQSRKEAAFVSLLLLLLLLLILCLNRFSRLQRQLFTLALSIVSIFFISFYHFAPWGDNYVMTGKTVSEDNELTSTETLTVKDAAEADGYDGFYRYSSDRITLNAGMLAGLSSTGYYWSIANPHAADFRAQTGMRDSWGILFTNYDDRTALTSLASVRYYVDTGITVPYGFIHDGEMPDTVYRNDHVLPLAYSYDASLSEDAWSALNEVKKQEVLLQTVVVDDGAAEQSGEAPALTSRSVPYTVEYNSDEIIQQDGLFAVTKANASVALHFEGLENSETYLVINGLDYSYYKLNYGDESMGFSSPYSQTGLRRLIHVVRENTIKDKLFWEESTTLPLTFESSAGVSKGLTYYTPFHISYAGRHDFAVNMGYTEDAVTSITVTFPSTGVYSFDDLEVICQPMDNYASQIAALKEDTLDDLTVGADAVSGTISLDRDKWLCFSIPYSTGWRAYVDGEEAELLRANIQYMALPLKAGDHTVELVYKTPLLRTGVCISAAAFAVLAVTVVVWERKRKHETRKHKV